MGRSPGFGSTFTNYSPYSDLVSLRLQTSLSLTLLVIVTRRTVLQKVHGRTSRSSIVCKHRVSGSFSLPSRGSFHRSFTVLYAIGHQGVFSLGRWSSRIPTGFLVSRGTLDPAGFLGFSSTGLSPSLVCFPKALRLIRKIPSAVLTPVSWILVWASSCSLAAT